jgi:hypothetical protein
MLLGGWLGGSRSEDEWHRNRLTQLYSDCMYYSYRIESSLSGPKDVPWVDLTADVSGAVRAGQLLFGYLDGEEWDRMNSALSAFSIYGPSYARGSSVENDRDKLKKAAHEMYELSASAYRYDARIFPQWRIFTTSFVLTLGGIFAFPFVLGWLGWLRQRKIANIAMASKEKREEGITL